MRFGVLGPVQVRVADRDLGTGSGRERLILSVLLFNADRVVGTDRLIDVLWDSGPPPTAKAQLHNAVSALRRRLRTAPGGDVLHTRPLGYELRLGEHLFDLAEFRMLAERARSAAGGADHARAVMVLTGALGLWCGPTLADVPGDWAAGIRRAVEEERLAAAELLAQSRLALGLPDEVLAELPALVGEHPYRERLRELQMLALLAAGRRADALAVYREVHQRFAADLGVRPGAALSSLHRRILTGEDPEPSAVTRLVPRQLPPLPLEIVGRRGLAAEITTTVGGRGPAVDADGGRGAAVPVGLLVGPGGIGKTSLAVSVAHDLAAAYPDGQLYANLRGSTRAPVDPSDVLAGWLRALGVAADVPADPDERAGLYRSQLAARRVLVLLDDAGSEQQVRPLLPGSATSAVLVTSRGRLAGLLGATRWTVPELSPAAALELFASIAGPDRSPADREDAAAIVAACGNLPLAVAISAARVAASPDRPLAELRARLCAAGGRLDELAVGDLDVRASIAGSYEALDPAVRRLFRRLGLLTGTEFPAWVVDQLAGDRRALVDRLVDVHLIERLGRDVVGQARFRMHDLVADYARELAGPEEPGHREVRAALVGAWLSLADRADERLQHGVFHGTGPPAPAAPAAALAAVDASPTDWFDRERAQLAAVVDEAVDLGMADEAGRLALRLSGFLDARGHEEGARVVRTALACVREHGTDELLGWLLGALVSTAARHDRLDELAELTREELAVAERTGDGVLLQRALNRAGMVARRLGDLRAALEWQHRAVSACDDRVPLRGRTSALAGLGASYGELGRPAEGLPHAREAHALERAGGIPRVAAMHALTYGTLLTNAGRYAEAGTVLAGALETAVDLHDELVAGFAHFRLGYVDLHLARPDAAETHLRRALGTFAAADDTGTTADVHRGLGDLAFVRGDPATAAGHLRRALTGWGSTGAHLEVARTEARLELAAARLGDPAAARRHRQRWRETFARLGLYDGCLCLPAFLRSR
ncbi:BTAD domain-containing putative transcriptional regulator [Longispora sp. K20-0274]|uniref:AfsR/SARP family transcriptional regulator n=1 Tax=Longispora sp. K20-0274 TaxID=3088255 RepID=UPI00399B407F